MRCVGPPSALFSLTLFFGVFWGVHGAFVNHTIDDTKGRLVQYLPTVPKGTTPPWEDQTTCAGCADVPDASLSFENTWSAALYTSDIGSISATMKFSGTAIYVFFILPNFIAGSGLASDVRCNFFIDSEAAGSYSHQSDNSGAFAYNTLVYKNVTVPDGDHVLLIETTGSDPAVIIFDYAIYTYVLPAHLWNLLNPQK
ncbi:hypothetical protein GGX14DRAFT_360872 [Mycena pura]|uniref:Uncharacterized protein n=1 Tax=Mycena pura TaxID=153505 RepID=A0AAD6VLZ2_9AGAR|nr:hypothetical protein GGX14DRAFT_360872 [Mycena pura]